MLIPRKTLNMRNLKKNVIIAGSTKCGTTSLYKYLVDHPDFRVPYTKETRFFLDQSYPLHKDQFEVSKDVYDQLFQGEGSLTCESSPDYFYSAGTAHEIKSILGEDALIVLVLRDPVQRILSWYRYAKQIGAINYRVSLYEFLSLQKEHYTGSYIEQWQLAVEQSHYKKYLAEWLKYFRLNEDILIFSTDELESSPKSVVLQILNRVGGDETFYDEYSFSRENRTQEARWRTMAKFYFFLARNLRIIVKKYPKTRVFLRESKKYLEQLIFKERKGDSLPTDPLLLSRLQHKFEDFDIEKIRNGQ